MARYAIYSTNTGTSTARPVTGFLELPDEPTETLADRVAAQPLEANEAIILLDADAQLLDLDSEVNTYGYTVNPTNSPAPLTAVSQARFSLQQRQAEHRRKRDQLIAEALPYANFGRNFGDTAFGTWLGYLKDLRNLADEPADPEGVSFPSMPSLSETDGLSVWLRLYRRGNALGSVSKVSGLPTGALFETEVVTQGAYEKSAGGWLKCSHRAAATFNTSGTLIFTWTFPHAYGSSFPARRTVKVEMSNRNNSGDIPSNQLSNARMGDLHTIVNSQGNASNVQILLRDRTNSLVAGDVCWLELSAEGRWD
jgi:hypothetical protein